MEKDLLEACIKGDTLKVKKLLSGDITTTKNFLQTLLPTFNSSTQPNNFLNVNIQDRVSGWTPLLNACFYGHHKIIELLLSDDRVDVNLEDKTGSTAFYFACEQGKIEIVEMLLRHPSLDCNKLVDGWTPLMATCFHGHTQVVKLLIQDSRLEMNIGEEDGETAFYTACENGRKEIVRLMLGHQLLDPNKATKTLGLTPLMIACQKGHLEIVLMLLNDKRVKFNNSNVHGESALHLACGYGQTEVAKLLLQINDLDINKESIKGWSPLTRACFNGHLEIVQWILESNHEIKAEGTIEAGYARLGSMRKAILEPKGSVQKQKDYLEIIDLLESFERNPELTRMKIRKELVLG